jgi:hypothetical protein
MLMLARDEETGETMTDAQLRDEVLTLLIARSRNHRVSPLVDVATAREKH